MKMLRPQYEGRTATPTMATSTLLRRKSSEAELNEIFTELSTVCRKSQDSLDPSACHSETDLHKVDSVKMSSSAPNTRPSPSRRSFSAPSPICLHIGNDQASDDQDSTMHQENVGTVKLNAEERLSFLEKRVHSQENEIVILKSSLANILRRLGVVEDNTKRPKGRMMPSIPISAASQPSALVRPSRSSTGSLPRSPRLEDESVDNQGATIVKGLLKSIRAKSPRPRSPEKPATPTVTVTTVGMTTVHSTSSPVCAATHEAREASIVQQTAPSSQTVVNGHQNGSAVTSMKNEVNNRTTVEDSRKSLSTYSKNTNGNARSSPSREMSSPRDSVTTTAHAHKLTDKSDSPRDLSSPRDVTTSARARKLRDKTTTEQKSRKLSRCVSEADLTTKRSRSRTVGSTPSKTPSNSDKTRRRSFSSGGTNLRRASSTSSLSIKDEHSTKPHRDEATRLYIRGRSLNLHPPSDFVADKNSGSPPEQHLQLEWIYGYRGRDCRDNLFYLPTGEMVYNMAAVVVLYNKETGHQRHYLGHNDDVKCIALHPNRLYVASGQVAGHDKDEGRPHVRVWDAITLDTLQVLGIGQFERAISCLAFSIKDNGRHLIVVDESNEHAISYWEWEDKRLISENKGSSDQVLVTVCHPLDQSIVVSCGKSHIAFWTVLESGGLMKKMGVYGKFEKPRFVLSLCFLTDGNLISGDSCGNILEWPQGTNHIGKAIIGAHEGGVFSLCGLDGGGFMSGGGRDRLIVLWNASYQPLKEFEMHETAGPVRSIARTVVQENGECQLAVGTTKNSLLTGTIDDGLSFLVVGHTDELWGLAVHPSRRMFITCGYDKQVMLCNADNHVTIWSKQFEEPLQSAAFHPKAFVLAIGTQSGNWMVLDSITGDQLGAFHDGPEQLDAIKYSPDGKYIAVGSHDNFVYMYTVSEDGRTYKRHGKLSGHSSFVTHLDWSVDSQYLQSNSGDYEILYWNAHRCRQVVSAYSMRDIKWETWTCVLGFPACGIWPDGADGTDINACCRSTSSEFLVTGDDFGQVNFFRYPVSQLKSDCQNCVGHSSHVTCVRFICDDTRVISTGGKDCSIMQWQIIN